MAHEDWNKRSLSVLAEYVGWALVILACACGIWIVARPIGVAIGLAISVAGAGLVTSAEVGAWVVPTAAVGVGLAGTAAAYLVIVRVVTEAKKAPYDWALPTLGIFAFFMTDLCKDYYFEDSKILQAVFAAVTAFMMLLGGFLVGRPQWIAKLTGMAMPIMAPAAVLMLVLLKAPAGAGTLTIHITDRVMLPVSPLIGIVGLAITSVLVILAGLSIDRREQAGNKKT